MWFDAEDTLIAAAENGTARAGYFTRWGDHVGITSGAALPRNRVHEALREFVRTRQRDLSSG